jgi:hypothetical protein
MVAVDCCFLSANNFDTRPLLDKEKADLVSEMMLLPQNAAVRRINELIKRARRVKVTLL